MREVNDDKTFTRDWTIAEWTWEYCCISWSIIQTNSSRKGSHLPVCIESADDIYPWYIFWGFLHTIPQQVAWASHRYERKSKRKNRTQSFPLQTLASKQRPAFIRAQVVPDNVANSPLWAQQSQPFGPSVFGFCRLSRFLLMCPWRDSNCSHLHFYNGESELTERAPSWRPSHHLASQARIKDIHIFRNYGYGLSKHSLVHPLSSHFMGATAFLQGYFGRGIINIRPREESDRIAFGVFYRRTVWIVSQLGREIVLQTKPAFNRQDLVEWVLGQMPTVRLGFLLVDFLHLCFMANAPWPAL